ncbi:isochorismatase family protein [Chakrabartyella piscis]|uniref:isochorismatase family protein n=1 Tax=Chakrabartyella piscis TaxID=2918914 RepID=UPI002958AC4A|nr:isochorismatase family protein [Chakrabartyella piscis]
MRVNAEDTMAIIIDFQEKLLPVMDQKEALIQKAATFAQGLVELEVPFVVSQQYTRGLGETVSELKDVIADGTYLEKNTFSCMGCEEIKNWVVAQGKKNVLISGIEAHICVMQTVVDLLEMGYNVTVVADCVGSRSQYDKEIGLERMKAEGAKVATCESILFELTVGAKNPHFKTISKLVK